LGKTEGTPRVARVERAVREELFAILRDEVKDPEVDGVIVTAVQMTTDLQLARVFVRLLEGGDDARRNRLVAALRRAGSLLRREVARRLRLRRAPELRFEYDTGVERAARVEELLAEIGAERRK
jgi:ribosome-binding factor A